MYKDDKLKEKIITQLKTIYDPEIPVNIYDLGLIYEVNFISKGNISIDMTLTTPNCPVAQTFPQQVGDTIESMSEVDNVSVNVVWDPPWTQDRMSDSAKVELNLL